MIELKKIFDEIWRIFSPDDTRKIENSENSENN